ncbi:MAG: hypothetical protein B7Z23_06350 [Pseudomonadales bacterium 32-61-5]|nr:MAG: hypothetical protein B7Z23_06350 [Pseudomonadales bacterium 32-61-5]
MIHGVSKHSTGGAAGAIDYFLDAEHFDVEAQQWKPRDPAPVIVEGDPKVIEALCDSQTFKHKYTSGVLSFTAEETAKIDSTPGLKQQILDDFKKHAFAGIKSDDAKPILVVEHRHLNRLELHYLIPRVNVESGLYFNPFPPNYDGKRGKGCNGKFIEHNDAFVGAMCERHGLQNPNDPDIKREVNTPKFEADKSNSVIRKQVVAAVHDLIDSKSISSREDIVKMLEGAGATITRKSDHSLSFKFEEMKKAIKLEGDYYGSKSWDSIAERHSENKARFEASRTEFESRYSAVFEERAGEVEKRHGKRAEAAESARERDPSFEANLRETVSALETKLDLHDSRDAATDFVKSHPSAMSIPSSPGGGGGGGGGGNAETADTSAGKTGDSVLDELISAFHSFLKAWYKKQAASLAPIVGPPKSKGEQSFLQAFSNLAALHVSKLTGYNFVEPSRGRLTLDDTKLYNQALRDELRETKSLLRTVIAENKAQEQLESRVTKPMELTEAVKKVSGPGLETGMGSLKALSEQWRRDMESRGRKGDRNRHKGTDFEM